MMRQIDSTARFKKDLKRLRKKYSHLLSDISPFLEGLKTGDTPGILLHASEELGNFYKLRVNNSDAKKGKSGGYRMVFAVNLNKVTLITLYSKSDQEDIKESDILRILKM